MDEQRRRTEADAGPDEDTTVEAPEFGPGGYLPERASRRARKIILRAPMGLQWVVGSLLVGVVVVVAGWLALRDTAPAAPFVEVPGVIGTTAVVEVADHDLIATDAGGRPRAFAWQPTQAAVVYCEASGLLEAADGRAWRVTGRGTAGTASLVPHRTTIHDGRFYVDPTTALEPPMPDPDPAETACAP